MQVLHFLYWGGKTSGYTVKWRKAKKRRIGECDSICIKSGPSDTCIGYLFARSKTYTKETHTHTHAEKGTDQVKTEAETGSLQPQPRNAQSHQKLAALSAPWFWISGIQKCERINFSCFKPPICGNILWQPQASNTRVNIVMLTFA